MEPDLEDIYCFNHDGTPIYNHQVFNKAGLLGYYGNLLDSDDELQPYKKPDKYNIFTTETKKEILQYLSKIYMEADMMCDMVLFIKKLSYIKLFADTNTNSDDYLHDDLLENYNEESEDASQENFYEDSDEGSDDSDFEDCDFDDTDFLDMISDNFNKKLDISLDHIENYESNSCLVDTNMSSSWLTFQKTSEELLISKYNFFAKSNIFSTKNRYKIKSLLNKLNNHSYSNFNNENKSLVSFQYNDDNDLSFDFVVSILQDNALNNVADNNITYHRSNLLYSNLMNSILGDKKDSSSNKLLIAQKHVLLNQKYQHLLKSCFKFMFQKCIDGLRSQTKYSKCAFNLSLMNEKTYEFDVCLNLARCQNLYDCDICLMVEETMIFSYKKFLWCLLCESDCFDNPLYWDVIRHMKFKLNLL